MQTYMARILMFTSDVWKGTMPVDDSSASNPSQNCPILHANVCFTCAHLFDVAGLAALLLLLLASLLLSVLESVAEGVA